MNGRMDPPGRGAVAVAAVAVGLIALCSLSAAACTPQAEAGPTPTGQATADKAAAAACSSGDLTARASSPNGASQHVAIVLIFTNESGHPCGLRGYPEVALLRADGTTIALAKQSTNGFFCAPDNCLKPATVYVPAGGEAGAVFEWADVDARDGGVYSAADCPDYGAASIRFTAPGASASALKQESTSTASLRIHICSDAIVHSAALGLGSGL